MLTMVRFGIAHRLALQVLLTTSVVHGASSSPTCRSQPGDPTFPTSSQLAAFNFSIDGRLVKVVPSAKFCMTLPGGCPDPDWSSANFRGNIPGAMFEVRCLLLIRHYAHFLINT